MVVDEDALDQTILEIESRIAVINTKKSELIQIKNALQSIQDQVIIRRGEDGKPTKEKKRKLDSGTRAIISDDRRNQIFDINNPIAKAKLKEKI